MTALDELVNLLDLEAIEVNIFRGVSPDENRQRVFGGQVAGQALVAATRTVETGRSSTRCTPTSCAPATPPCPSSTRSTASATARASPPAAWSPSSTARPSSTCRPASTPTSPAPTTSRRCRSTCPTAESLPDFKTRMAPYKERMGEWYDRPRPIDLRHVDGDPFSRQGVTSFGQKVWLRADGAPARRPDRCTRASSPTPAT